MNRGRSPLAVVILVIAMVAVAGIAIAVKYVLGDYLGKMTNIVFWLVIIGLGGGASFLIGKYFGGDRRSGGRHSRGKGRRR